MKLSEAAAVSRAPPTDGADPPYLAGLNPPQREAVETLDGPVLLLAGAGTGKTRALTTRLAHILTTGRAYASQVLAVTFTNRAASEMRERVRALVGDEAERIWLGTFHALAARILRRHAEQVGLRPDFTILDQDDQIRLIKQIMEAADIDTKKWPPRVLHGVIERWKDRGLTPEKLKPDDGGDLADGRSIEIYTTYQRRLLTLNATDFGDLLLHNLTLFQAHADILAEYHKRFRFLLVDEYQDTNVAQYLWLRLLAQASKNICCVGDDDQSIYGWRGAEVGNILRFEKDFPGAKIIRLEQNYRSTQPILAAAGHLIAHNEGRLGKTLWTDAEGGDKLSLRGVWDGEEEARVVADMVEDLQRKQHALNEIAILVRASFQTREFEERFITLGIPYRVIGGPRFYERMEIRDAIAYLRLVHSTDDDLAFERIVNKPRRGIGDATLQALHRLARAREISLVEAARLIVTTEELKTQGRNALIRFLDLLGTWRALAEAASHVELAETVLDDSGYTAMWQQDKSADAPGRLENLKELIHALEEFDTLAGFLEHISLVMDTNQAAQGDMVSIMTLHSAKGLEFDSVFLPGWEEGLFPHQRALDDSGQAGLEEERRLAYVGLTRARKNVHLSFAANRRIHNQWQSAIPSRFVDELPASEVEVATDRGLYGSARGTAGGRGAWDEPAVAPWRGQRETAGGGETSTGTSAGTSSERGERWRPADRYAWKKRVPGAGRMTDEVIDGTGHVVETKALPGGFKMGERVRHAKFGYGVVRSVDGDKLAVIFEDGGEKKVLDSFVEKA